MYGACWIQIRTRMNTDGVRNTNWPPVTSPVMCMYLYIQLIVQVRQRVNGEQVAAQFAAQYWSERFQSGFFSPLCPRLFSCAALGGSGSGSWAALCRLLLFGDGRLCFASEGLGGIQLVQVYISSCISCTDLAAEYQRLVQRGPLLQRQEEQTVTTGVNRNNV